MEALSHRRRVPTWLPSPSCTNKRPATFAGREFNSGRLHSPLQIEAPGYLTWRTSQRYKMGDASPKLDVRLKPTLYDEEVKARGK
jgi:hypothetical protein